MPDLPDVYVRFQHEDEEPIGEGDCTDLQHLGEDGWIEIQSFSFGFGFNTPAGQAARVTPRKFVPKGKTIEDMQKEFAALVNAQQQQQQQQQERDSASSGSHEWGQSGALNFEKCKISKSADSLSSDLVNFCHDGDVIKYVTLEACRSVGDDAADAGSKIKAPFLRIKFEDVFLRTCSLQLATEGLPTESYEMEYNKVTVETWWTDNATGTRQPERPFRVSWDLNANQGDFEAADT